jgi:hypothetical protein
MYGPEYLDCLRDYALLKILHPIFLDMIISELFSEEFKLCMPIYIRLSQRTPHFRSC